MEPGKAAVRCGMVPLGVLHDLLWGAVPHAASAAGLQWFSGDTGETLAECFIIDASP